MSFDIAVIGAGMIGSSCAKYLADIGLETVLIGPQEKQKLQCHGAWFDEARITRIFDSSPYWMDLAVKSIERYRDIEKKSGVSFYDECGYMAISTEENPKLSHFKNNAKNVHMIGYDCNEVDQNMFAMINFPENYIAFHESSMAGILNPRKMIKAQKSIAVKNGCKIINDSLERFERRDDHFELFLHGDKDKVFKAKKIVLANGSYVNFIESVQHFAPNGKTHLDLKLTAQTVAYVEISESQAMEFKSQKFPSIVTSYNDGLLDGTYILPPVKYPDGKWIIKLGHHDVFEKVLENESEVKDWYENHEEGSLEAVLELERFLKEFLPGMKVLGVKGGSCVTTKTPERLAPFVDEIGEGVFVAVGGCGYAAKSCDEIGRIAAVLAAKQEWTTKIPRRAMRAQWK